MPPSRPVQVTLIAGRRSQPVEKAGFKSLTSTATLHALGIPSTGRDCDGPADLAWHRAALAGNACWLDWIDTNLRRCGIALTSRLPHRDAIGLAWAVATGKMTWPEINLALDAAIKRGLGTARETAARPRWIGRGPDRPRRVAGCALERREGNPGALQRAVRCAVCRRARPRGQRPRRDRAGPEERTASRCLQDRTR